MDIFFFLMICLKKKKAFANESLTITVTRSHLVVSSQCGHVQGSEGAAAQLLHV